MSKDDEVLNKIAKILANRCVTLNGEIPMNEEELRIIQKAGYLKGRCVMLNGRIKITYQEFDEIIKGGN